MARCVRDTPDHNAECKIQNAKCTAPQSVTIFHSNQEALMNSAFSCAMAIAALALSSIILSAADAPKYKVVNTFKVGGEGGWDYLLADPDSHNIFLSRGTHLMIISDSGQPVGDISGTEGIHG